jgi:dihydroflavonol-4-reductase
MARKKRVVTVTGASGFVGNYVVERLLAEGDYEVRCLVRRNSNIASLALLAKDLEFVFGDITRPETLEAAFEGSWGVINLAGCREFWNHNRERFYDLNERGASNVYKACLAAGVKKVVQVSTPLAYGLPDSIPFDETAVAGPHASDYARSKYLGDQAGDDTDTMEVRRAVEGKLPALVGADTTFTYLYVGDAAEAITRALIKKDSIGKSYLIGNQRATTRGYFNTIGKLAGVAVPDRNIPESWLFPVARGMEVLSRFTGRRPVLPLDVLKTTAAGSLLFDARRSIEELGMTYTPLETALMESIVEIRLSA